MVTEKQNLSIMVSEENNSERFVPIEARTLKTHLQKAFWDPIAKNSCYINWKEIPVQKDPFQIVMMQQLIQELKPKTIIEFGSFRGGSALWLADIQSLSVESGKVISIDIDLDNIHSTVKGDMRINFIQGDCNYVEKIFPLEKTNTLSHPILLIEDAHINTIGILEYFHQNILNIGDYVIVEDTNIDYNNACYKIWEKILENEVCVEKLANLNSKIIKLEAWLKKHNNKYLVDTKYVDPFGILNGSKNWNSVLRRTVL